MSDNNKVLEYELNLAYLQKHIEYSKRFRPKLSAEAKFMLKEYYLVLEQNMDLAGLVKV